MRPEDTRPVANISVPPRQASVPIGSRSASNQAAADLVRNQIDTIYSQDPHHTAPLTAAAEPVTETVSEFTESSKPFTSGIQPGPGGVTADNIPAASQSNNPYERTHNEQQHQTNDGAWRSYHSAWQSYYQQYYERYYVGKVHEVKQSLESESNTKSIDTETVSSNEAMYDLREKLRGQISEKAKTVRKSRHFIPVIAGCLVMMVFLVLQYNRNVLAAVNAYVTPSSLDPSSLIIDQSAAGLISAEPKLIIPSIGVDVPIVWDAVASNETSLNAAMDKGVAWFNIKGANARPGEMGNFVLSGHSSNDWLDPGDYKFIFARLEQMKEGDPIYVNYNSVRYTYTITKMQVVKPTDVRELQIGNDKPSLTLVTCTPLGTATNRLLVFADQIAPDPGSATAHDETDSSGDASEMPSNSPTFIERLFGGQ